MINRDYYIVISRGESPETLLQRVGGNEYPPVSDFLDFIDDNESTNFSKIVADYTDTDLKTYKSDIQSGILTFIKTGTKVVLPKEFIEKDYYVRNGVYEPNVNINTSAFIADKLDTLNNRVKSYSIANLPLDSDIGIAKQYVPNVSVWLWSRSIGLEKELINISPFVQFLSIRNNGSGSFSITLPPLPATRDPQTGTWNIDKDAILQFKGSGVEENHVILSNYYRELNIEESEFYGEGRSFRKRNNYFFYNAISENDLIFIRFEKLEVEQQGDLDNGIFRRDDNNFRVPTSQIAGNIFDMIGLVDTVTKNEDAASPNISISVTGRDLSKVLFEDGCYFDITNLYTIEGAQDPASENENVQFDFDSRIQLSSRKLAAFAAPRSLKYSIEFVISQLSNIGLIPDTVFDSYGFERNFKLEFDENSQFIESSDYRRGVWQIWDFLFDSTLANRLIYDSAISAAQGSIQNFIDQICESPLIEFYSDTYLDRFTSIIRQPPFTEDLYKSLIPEQDSFVGNILDEDIHNMDLQYETDFYTWFSVESKYSPRAGSSPIIPLYDFIDIYGYRPFYKKSNYMLNNNYEGKSKTNVDNSYVTQTYSDLKYIIDCHSYLPFTEKGTITLNGDRRIKRGTVVRLVSSGKLAYVDEVEHTYSISNNTVDRKTILTLSRVMVEKFVRGERVVVEKDGQQLSTFMSYFNIVNTDLQFTTTIDDNGNSRRSIANSWQVNRDVFDFFVARKQFDY